MKIKIILFSLSIFFLSFINAYSSETKILNTPEMRDIRFACKSFFEILSKSKDSSVRNFYTFYQWNDYGFYIKEKFSIKENKYKYFYDKNNNLVVDTIYNFETASKIKSGDSILSINDKKKISGDQFNNIIVDENLSELKIRLLNKIGEEYEVKITKSYNDYKDVRYKIQDFNITNIDIKKGTYDLSVRHNFVYSYTTDTFSNEAKNHPILEAAIGTITYYNHDQERHMFHICGIPEKIIKDQLLLLPEDGLTVKNILRNDRDLEIIKRRITPYHKLTGNLGNEVTISTEKFNVLKIENKFNLKSFPFDRQTIKFEIVDRAYHLNTRIINPSSVSYKTISNFMKEDDIPGWKKKSYSIDRATYKSTDQMRGTYSDSSILSIVLERKPGYYLFKVIFPILLILSVCWSAVWVDPREIESRLTITIVCLLSLIAYNFVIDSELPKLEYLTIMDYIILISYIYATIPNFLSVISFNLIKKDKLRAEKYEAYEKRLGLPSYLLIIFLIVLANANTNPEHTASMLGWMKLK